jgi:hypothetical protein
MSRSLATSLPANPTSAVPDDPFGDVQYESVCLAAMSHRVCRWAYTVIIVRSTTMQCSSQSGSYKTTVEREDLTPDQEKHEGTNGLGGAA